MNRILFILTFMFVSQASSADTYVKEYVRKDGTTVEAHHRSDRNNTTTDNWDTKGNTNPYTGVEGRKSATDYNPYH